VKDQVPLEGLADGLLGDIVVGGAQPPRGDDNIGTAQGQVDGLDEAVRVIAGGGDISTSSPVVSNRRARWTELVSTWVPFSSSSPMVMISAIMLILRHMSV